MSIEEQNKAFADLGPDSILDAVESAGYRCDGRFLALNSYENRVYQVGLEEGPPLVAKFYRPGRWSDEAIIEEHAFTRELAAREIPVVAPLTGATGQSLHQHGSYRFALYPRRGGRAPELDNPEHLEQMGRFLARIHALGEVEPFVHRPALDIHHFGIESYQFLLSRNWIPRELETAYRTLAEDLIKRIQACYTAAGATSCGPTRDRTSWISTMRAWALRYRTCGCFSPGTAAT